MLEEWDPREEPNLCIRAMQELSDQLPQAWEVECAGQTSFSQLGWCPIQNQWVARWMGGGGGPPDLAETAGRGKRWEST